MHDHTHNSELSSQRVGWAFALNVGFTIIEFVGGMLQSGFQHDGINGPTANQAPAMTTDNRRMRIILLCIGLAPFAAIDSIAGNFANEGQGQHAG